MMALGAAVRNDEYRTIPATLRYRTVTVCDGHVTSRAVTVTTGAVTRGGGLTLRRMRPITFLAALVAALQLMSSSALASGEWTWPVRGEVITPYRNGTDPYAAGQHRGIDIASPVGTPVVAATRGSVTFAGVAGSSGLTVAIRTAGGRFDTSYLHLSSVSVHDGDSVAAGQRVGAGGTSGPRSAAPAPLPLRLRPA